MKMIIEIPGLDKYIAMDAEHASYISGIIAQGQIVQCDDRWSDQKTYRTTGEVLRLAFVEDKCFSGVTERETALEKKAAASESDRWKEYRRAEDLKKERDQLAAQVELLKSVTVCTVAEPETSAEDDGRIFSEESK